MKQKNITFFKKVKLQHWFVFIIAIVSLCLLTKAGLKTLEKRNIQEIQAYFDSLDKKALEVDVDKNQIQLPSPLIGKTIGIYCEVGKVRDPTNITVKFLNTTPKGCTKYEYNTILLPVIGEKVTVFFPVFVRKEGIAIQLHDNRQCKAYYWSDLKDWKGPLWEGSYDKNALKHSSSH